MGKQSSPRSPRPEPLVPSGNPYLERRLSGGEYHWSKTTALLRGLKNEPTKLSTCKSFNGKRHVRSIVFTIGLLGFLLWMDSLMVSIFDSPSPQRKLAPRYSSSLNDNGNASVKEENLPMQMHTRLLNLASIALSRKETRHDSTKFWEEASRQASKWKPCADRGVPSLGKSSRKTGFILVSANGGLNQQRVAVCNAVAVAALLNATLVLPKFLYSNVWKDPSQFGDIYQEEYFMDTLKDDVDIIKELPHRLQSLDLKAIGSLITDADIVKEAKPREYIEKALPLLLRNGVVHFLGFGNRLGFDPVPFEILRLRCKCNFHALKFVPKIQELGSLLVKRIRKSDVRRNMLDKQLLGNFISRKGDRTVSGPSKYLALHLRFEVDMVAYSFCEFGGGETERRKLQEYREIHFSLVLERLKNSKPVSPREQRMLGKCPLTPEEAALVLAGLGFKSQTYIYLAGSQIYGGQSRMHPFTRLYPNLVTKEDLLTPTELSPFRNFTSQLAALDLIACATADVFAMTDSGSQLASLVSGLRTYYGIGKAPTLRPNKKRLAAILSENSTLGWHDFEASIRKMFAENQMVHTRPFGRSIYRQPRCPECMCKTH
ncbi:GDP-fucose protein O-fucosyltransferase [Dillenia turbinata]|uniref:O-fucosyltransferase family protein n=1 Tax=Dillenia turbinata TaxID=194707 RepID=A0AAN8UVT7_9MAGN